MKRFPYASYAFGPSHADGGGSGQAIYFEDNFETGDLSKWNGYGGAGSSYPTNINVAGTVTHGGAYACGFRYVQVFTGVPTGRDTNRWIYKVLAGKTEFYMRGYLYLVAPLTQGLGVQRKLMWCGDDDVAGGTYDCVVTLWETNAGSPSYCTFGALSQHDAGISTGLYQSSSQQVHWDTWHCVEIYFKMNTVNPSDLAPWDGILRTWLDGSEILYGPHVDPTQGYDNLHMNMNGMFSNPFSTFSIGRQTNSYQGEQIDEWRYWDDVKIASSYIGT